MKLCVLLSCMNIDKYSLDKFNITSNCVVINQCDRNKNYKYKNFNIYDTDTIGVSISRNMAIDKSSGDILLFCDDDVTYNDKYESIIINEFKKTKADVIFFNLDSPNRKIKINKNSKRLNYFNIMRYGTYRMAVRKSALKNIRFDNNFGGNNRYGSGEDSILIHDLYKSGAIMYRSNKYIGKVMQEKSTWFKGFNKKYFYDKGALFTRLNYYFRYLFMIRYLIRYRYLYDMSIFSAFKYMYMGSRDYIENRGDLY